MNLQLRVIGLAGFFLIVGLVILLEHFLNYGVWFQLEDIHHETFVVATFVLAFGVILGSKLFNKQK